MTLDKDQVRVFSMNTKETHTYIHRHTHHIYIARTSLIYIGTSVISLQRNYFFLLLRFISSFFLCSFTSSSFLVWRSPFSLKPHIHTHTYAVATHSHTFDGCVLARMCTAKRSCQHKEHLTAIRTNERTNSVRYKREMKERSTEEKTRANKNKCERIKEKEK